MSIPISDVGALVRFRFLVVNLVSTQLKLRYHRSALGVCWTLLNPLLLLGVQAIAFSQILNLPVASYALYLLSGLVPWQFFSTAIEAASRALITNERLIKAMPIPKFIFPLTDVVVSLVHAGFALVAFLLLAILFGAPIQRQIVLLPVGAVLLAAFTLGLALIAMTLMTFFRDFAHVIGVFLTAYYFASPILYPPEMVGRFAAFLRYNPMSYYLEFFHDALVSGAVLARNPGAIGGVWPPPSSWLIATSCSLIALVAGYAVYKKYEHEFIFQL